MTERDFLKLITSGRAGSVLEKLSRMPATERRAFAKPAMSLYKSMDSVWVHGQNRQGPKVKDGEAVTIAVLATASASELKKLPFFPQPEKISLEDIVRKLDPDWVQDVVDHFVELRTFYVSRFRPLWQAGLCMRPTSDAIILAYYSHWGHLSGFDEEALLQGDVWRFFEVEGGGEDSLANHEKYLKGGQEGWAEQLKRYAEQGKLDRQRLLDASLDALERDFGQYRAGWYSRFHVLMAPDTAEMTARAERYLGLLASSIPPTVTFAIKHVTALAKLGAVDPAALIAALESPLQARTKGTVLSALKLLLMAAKHEPDLATTAASKAVLALISEDAGVQGKALDIIEALGVEPVATELAAYVDLVAPSVRSRLSQLTGVEATEADAVEMGTAPPEAKPIAPVASAQDALALFLSVLEAPRDPFDVERAMDGISRFGAALRKETAMLSPLKKRAEQLCKSPGNSDIRLVLALTGRALTGGEPLANADRQQREGGFAHAIVKTLSWQEAHLARNVGVLARIDAEQSLPLLSLPSDTSGTVSATDLLSRMALYRAAKVAPDLKDLALALMRLNPEKREVPDLPGSAEADKAVAYALGSETAVGPTPALWAAAWCARAAATEDQRVVKLFTSPMPDCGVPARWDLRLTTKHSNCGAYKWLDVSVPVTPENDARVNALPALFGIKQHNNLSDACSGHTFEDIAWASLARPADPEPFFRAGLVHQDTWQKLTDNPTRAYLEPFFRPGPAVGALGASLLAYYMACEDKSVASLATEATAVLSLDGRLSAEQIANAIREFLLLHTLPTSRWTKAMQVVAELGAATFARKVLVDILDFPPEVAPREIGGLLELCYELHVAQDARLDNKAAISYLQDVQGGGKIARFRKKLLELTPSTTTG